MSDKAPSRFPPTATLQSWAGAATTRTPERRGYTLAAAVSGPNKAASWSAPGAVGAAQQGVSVALSADGNTAILGGPGDNSNAGAAWVFALSGGVWTQQGNKLVGSGAVANPTSGLGQGYSVAMSADGNTAIMGGYNDNSSTGAAWVFTRSGGVWTQQGSKLVGTGGVGPEPDNQGDSVAMSADGNTAILGGPGDNSNAGAAWVFVQPLQVSPATNIAATGNPGGPFAPSSFQYQLSATSGSINYSISGVPSWLTPSSTSGTASASGTTVTFTVNANATGLAVGTYGPTTITFTNTDTGQGTQTRTATLTVNPPALQVTPATNIAATGTQGGPFSPSSFSYTLSVASGSVSYSISNVPSWLTPSSTSGTPSAPGTTVTFTVNANATGLTPNTYVTSINFNNTTNGQGNTARVATLTVNPPPLLQVTPATNMVASGTQGGPFSSPSFSYTLSATSRSINYSISGIPAWLTPSLTSGTASSPGTTVSFTVNANANSLAVGTYGPTTITFTNTDTGQGTQTRTATLTVNPPALLVAPSTGITASGTHGGSFSPSSFRYMISATFGNVKYSITTPSWLTASSGSGTVTTSAKTITFTVNSSARSLGPSTYTDNIDFNNTTNNQGNTTRLATLIVNPKQFKITVEASPKADGTVSGGGTFAEGTSHMVIAMPNTGRTFVHWTGNGKVVSTSESYTFTLDGNVTLVADFR
jgi:Divergent InlB B-repeat domain/Viral BACON domain